MSRIKDSKESFFSSADQLPQTATNTPSISGHNQQTPAPQDTEDYFPAWLLARLNSRNGYESSAELNTSFANEVIDAEWAPGQEQLLSSVFASELLHPLVPESIACKRTRCQIRIPMANTDDASAAATRISRVITAVPELSHTRIESRFNQNFASVDIYFFRDTTLDK